MAETLSSLLISLMGFLVSLYLITEVRAITLSPAIFERAEMSSSVMPSEKISSLASWLMFASGRTAILRLSGCCCKILLLSSALWLALWRGFVSKLKLDDLTLQRTRALGV